MNVIFLKPGLKYEDEASMKMDISVYKDGKHKGIILFFVDGEGFI